MNKLFSFSKHKKNIDLKAGIKFEAAEETSKMNLEAPVEEMQTAGVITYYIENKKWGGELLVCKEKVEKINYEWCLKQIVEKILY